MISFIGLGAGGSNISEVASQNGFRAGTINFSQSDINSLTNVKYRLKMLGTEGVGHDRQKAISLFSEQHETAIKFIRDNFSDDSNEMLIFPFACGGGSGSGIAPVLIDLVSHLFEDKVIVAMPILPDHSESTVAQMNTLDVFRELFSLNVCILPLDNQQVKSLYNIDSKSVLYQQSNNRVIDLFCKLIQYTEKSSKNGIFDKRDFLTLFSQKGIATIAEVDVARLKQDEELLINKQGISHAMQKSWKSTIFTPIEMRKVTKSAIISDTQEELLQYIDKNIIFDQFELGLPIDIFEGVYNEQYGKIITVLTGLSWCKSRLQQIEQIIEDRQTNIQKMLSEEEEYKPKQFNILTSPKQPKEKKSAMDILSKYRR